MDEYFDPILLVDPADSRSTCLHLKIRDLFETDIDKEKVGQFGYSGASVRGWLSGQHTVPIIVLKNCSILGARIDYINCKNSRHRVNFPKVNEELFYFLGVILGDGCIKNSFRPSGHRRFTIKIEKLRTRFSEFCLPKLVEEVFGFKPQLYFRKKKSELVAVTINSKVVSRMLTNIFGFAYGKKIDKPVDFVLQFPEHLQLYFIAGLLDTDGGYSGKNFAFCNSSKKMVLYVKDFMEKHSIETRFYPQRKGPFEWFLLFVQSRSRQKFLDTFPLLNERKFGNAGGEI